MKNNNPFFHLHSILRIATSTALNMFSRHHCGLLCISALDTECHRLHYNAWSHDQS